VADAVKQISYFNGSGATGASADFFVAWNGDIYQYNMDIKNRYSWAVGGGRQSQSGGAYYGKCLNRNQISIEMCCKSKTGAYVGANNSAWYFTDSTVKATAQLVRELMDAYGIDPAHVIRHYDVNGKYCPGIKGWNAPSGSEEEWKKFKALISTETPEEKTEQEPAKVEQKEEKAEQKTGGVPYLVRVTIKTLRIRKGPGTGYPWSRYIAPGIYTIVEERYGEGSKAGWGRLKSGAGWISLDYARRVE
jgi:N-acetylmuramoyl-L-alanine amidase CwlA